ncbi:MAG: nuclear transport factor 2 family protein [Saprospiraceae bacterium]
MNKINLINAIIDTRDELIVSPSITSSSDDFDFLIGPWDIQNKKLRSRLDQCTDWIEFEARADMKKNLNGLGNTDRFLTSFNQVDFEGMSLRLFNSKTKLWNIYWADSNLGVLDPPVVGSFDGNIGTFYGKDKLLDKPVVVMFQWDKTIPEKPIWSQAFSPDQGLTWEWNWYMYHQRPVESNSINDNSLTELFNKLYEHFNDRKIDAVVNQMSENVKWANGMEGGFVHGKSAVRSYWIRQFELISFKMVPMEIMVKQDQVQVKVHRVVHDLQGNLIADEIVSHRFTLDRKKIIEFNIENK